MNRYIGHSKTQEQHLESNRLMTYYSCTSSFNPIFQLHSPSSFIGIATGVFQEMWCFELSRNTVTAFLRTLAEMFYRAQRVKHLDRGAVTNKSALLSVRLCQMTLLYNLQRYEHIFLIFLISTARTPVSSIKPKQCATITINWRCRTTERALNIWCRS